MVPERQDRGNVRSKSVLLSNDIWRPHVAGHGEQKENTEIVVVPTLESHSGGLGDKRISHRLLIGQRTDRHAPDRGHVVKSALAAAVEGPVTTMITASALQWHPDTQVFCDEPAAANLRMREYYDWIRRQREADS